MHMEPPLHIAWGILADGPAIRVPLLLFYCYYLPATRLEGVAVNQGIHSQAQGSKLHAFVTDYEFLRITRDSIFNQIYLNLGLHRTLKYSGDCEINTDLLTCNRRIDRHGRLLLNLSDESLIYWFRLTEYLSVFSQSERSIDWIFKCIQSIWTFNWLNI